MNDQHLGAAVRAACRRLAPEDVGKRSDAELLQRFLDRRDEGAFAGLMERHGPMVLGVCRRLLPSHHDAEDAFQATFLVLSQRAASVRRRPSLAAWLHGVARRTALCARRAALRRRRHEGQATSPAPSSPAAELTWREVCEVLEGEIARLPEKYREVFLLCCREGRSRAEAAGLLGLKEGTIASRLDTARKRLRDRLARRGISLGTALSATALTPDVPAGTLPVMAAKGTAAAALAKEVTRAMALGKIKYAAAVLAAGLIAAGAGGLALSGPGPAPPPPPGTSDPEDRNVAKTNSAAQPEAGAEGAGLPEHARARLGTVRFRQEGRVRVVAFGPGGKTLLSGADSTINPLRLRDEDRGLILWDALTGRPIRGFRPPEVPERPGRFLSAAYSRDGKFVAGAFGPPGVFVWDAATGNLVRDFPPGKLDQAMAFSPDGKMLYVASREPSVRRFDVAAGRELEPVPGQSRSLVPAFSPDGKLFAAAGSDDKGTFLTLYDTAGRELWSVRAHRSTVRDLTFTPDGKALLTGSSDGTACLWSAADGKRLLELRHPEKSWAYAVAVTPDGAELITGCTDGVIRVWDAKTGRELRRIEGSRVAVRSLDVSPDGTVLASCSGSAILLWDLRTGSPVFPIDGHLDRPEAVAFSPVAPLVATAGWDRTVLLWDAATGKELRRLTGHGQGVSALAFSPDGKLLASGGNNDDASIRVWEVATGRELARYKGHQYVRYLRWFPDGTRLVSGDAVDDASVRIWQVIGADGKVVAKGEPLQKFKVTPTRASAMAFSPDGKLVATAADVPFRGGRGAAIDVHIWDIATGKEVRRIEGAGDGQIRGLAFSPDGKYLAIGGSGGLGFKIATRLWDVATGKEVQSFETLADYLAFSPDGRMLAAARLLSPTVEVWEVASGQKRAEFDTRSGSVLGLAFSADGRTLASLGENTTAVLWDLTLGQRAAEPADLEATWKELSAADAAAAYRALRKLTAAGDAAVPFLAERLRPVRTADAETVRRLIARLESPRFAEREKAARELADLGSAAVPFLREALQGQPAAEARRQIERLLEEHAPEGLSPARLRQLRAVEALEQAGTPAARRLLGELAGGVPGDRLSAEAAAALRRLERPGAPR